ncbi:MAG: ABC transporter permease [Acidimicrobiia bacterium]
MTTTTIRPSRGVSLQAAVIHTLVITRRNLLRTIRRPEILFFATVQPVMFLLLFNYVFGGAINIGIPGIDSSLYINWLIPGILVQSAVFGSTGTSVGLTEDLGAGVIDRFRSLPMARSAVLSGRTLADLGRNVFVLGLMMATGYAMGWRFEQGLVKMLLGFGIALLFGYAFSWVMALMGLLVKTPEAAQTAGFLPIFPLVFGSSIFVPTETLPDWLRAFADAQPVTILADTVRSLMIPEQAASFMGLDQGTLILQSLAWVAGIVAVFAPLAVWKYRRTVI